MFQLNYTENLQSDTQLRETKSVSRWKRVIVTQSSSSKANVACRPQALRFFFAGHRARKNWLVFVSTSPQLPARTPLRKTKRRACGETFNMKPSCCASLNPFQIYSNGRQSVTNRFLSSLVAYGSAGQLEPERRRNRFIMRCFKAGLHVRRKHKHSGDRVSYIQLSENRDKVFISSASYTLLPVYELGCEKCIELTHQ